ncbi:hypothetical protein LG201_05290 [Methylobacillus gramineus]|nr:hypothetical protein [Methylobacillus gramineus]MCB5184614.1 hypothetical protein [Methylobacillus gramineus]
MIHQPLHQACHRHLLARRGGEGSTTEYDKEPQRRQWTTVTRAATS